MYVEAQPASIHAHLLNLGVESPQPQLRRPPAVLTTSSSSSLKGMEKGAPSFQSFIKRTPPPDSQRPRASVAEVPARCGRSASSTTSSRRTSSVYSRTVSRYAPTPESWNSKDFLKSDLFLQPSIYSLSTPEVDVTSKDSSTLLQPRTYSPLIASPLPSPSPSRNRTLSPPMEHRPSILLPPSLPSMRVSPHHVKTVSLDKANAAAHFPGARSLLPEELRALAQQKYQKKPSLRWSRSLEGIGAPGSLLVPPPLPPFVEDVSHVYSTTPRRLVSHSSTKQSSLEWLSGTVDSKGQKLSDTVFDMDAAARAAVTPVARQSRNVSLVKAAIRAGLLANEPDFEDRGRSRQRQSGSIRSPVILDHFSHDDLSEGDAIVSEAQRLAEEYHALLREQNTPPTSRRSPSLDKGGKDIRLVPQPLFFNPRKISKQRAQEYQKYGNDSVFTSPAPGPELKSPPKKRRASLKWPGFPLKLSLTPDSTRDRSQSTSGSIPISPPFPVTDDESPSKKSLFPSLQTQPQAPKIQRNFSISGPSPSFSDFPPTPSVQPARRSSLSSWLGRGSISSPVVPSYTPTLQPVSQTGGLSTWRPGHKHKTSDESGSGTSSAALAPKNPLTKGFASFTAAFSKPQGHAPSLRSLTEQPKPSVSPMLRQISAPIAIVDGGPSDGGRLSASMRDEGVSGKRPSLFAGVLDQRRESKANKRRQELKRTIRVVPEVQERAANARDGEWL